MSTQNSNKFRLYWEMDPMQLYLTNIVISDREIIHYKEGAYVDMAFYICKTLLKGYTGIIEFNTSEEIYTIKSNDFYNTIVKAYPEDFL